jgi:hypothetical protein
MAPSRKVIRRCLSGKMPLGNRGETHVSNKSSCAAVAIAGIALSCACLAYSPAAADLIQNGGFETGDFTGWTLGTASNSLVAQAGQIPGLNPHSGNHFAALQEKPPPRWPHCHKQFRTRLANSCDSPSLTRARVLASIVKFCL